MVSLHRSLSRGPQSSLHRFRRHSVDDLCQRMGTQDGWHRLGHFLNIPVLLSEPVTFQEQEAAGLYWSVGIVHTSRSVDVFPV